MATITIDNPRRSSMKFYMVVGDNPTMKRWNTKEEAWREADRLSALHPGSRFFITKTVAYVYRNKDGEPRNLNMPSRWG